MLGLIKKMTRYCAVGLVALAVDYASYFLFTRLFHMMPYAANIVAYCCGNIISFIGHRFFTFHTTGNPAVFREYAKFALITVLGLAISEFIVVYSIKTGISDFIGKGAAVVVSGMFNFYFNNIWTFRPAKCRS
jgi:putative flippase GtrA